MQRYVRFSPELFLRESRHWKYKIKKLEEERDSIAEVQGIDTTKPAVQTSGTGDTVANAVQRRVGIENKILKLQRYQHVFDYTWGKLTADEQELLTGFFFSRKRIEYFVFNYGRKHGLSMRQVYRARREALDHYAEIVTEYCGI